MFGNKSSWFPLKSLTSSPCHFDWMLGSTKFFGTRDALVPTRIIPPMATVFWNRTLRANVSLKTYEEIRKTRDPVLVRKCEEMGLPLDARV